MPVWKTASAGRGAGDGWDGTSRPPRVPPAEASEPRTRPKPPRRQRHESAPAPVPRQGAERGGGVSPYRAPPLLATLAGLGPPPDIRCRPGPGPGPAPPGRTHRLHRRRRPRRPRRGGRAVPTRPAAPGIPWRLHVRSGGSAAATERGACSAAAAAAAGGSGAGPGRASPRGGAG